MLEDKLVERLPQMSAEKLFQVPSSVLFDELPQVPAEQLAPELVPTVGPGLPDVVHVRTGGNDSLFAVPQTAELGWSTLAEGTQSVERILGKFTQRLEQVQVRVRQLRAEPGETLGTAGDTSVYETYRVEIADIGRDDILAAHLTFSVEKAWLETEGLHKWSVQLAQFDETRRSWVESPSKRGREDGRHVYYTAVLPHFSDIAITGKPGLPEQVFRASDLVIAPSAPHADDQILVSVAITNTGEAIAVYPATLWINGTIEAAQSIPIGAGETALVEFRTSRPEGTYRVRLDRLMGDLTVGAASLSSPTPTVTVTPTLKPSPTPTPEASSTPLAFPAAPTRTPTPEPLGARLPSPGGTAAPPEPTSVAPQPLTQEAGPIPEASATRYSAPGRGLSGAAIAAAVVGGLGFVALIGAGGYLLYRRRQTKLLPPQSRTPRVVE